MVEALVWFVVETPFPQGLGMCSLAKYLLSRVHFRGERVD